MRQLRLKRARNVLRKLALDGRTPLSLVRASPLGLLTTTFFSRGLKICYSICMEEDPDYEFFGTQWGIEVCRCTFGWVWLSLS